MAYNLSRMTIFALLSSIENDLRENIKFAINGLDKDKIKIEQNIHKKINDRFEKENGFKNTEDNLIELVDYLDLGDTFQIINSNKEIFIDDFSAKIKQYTKTLENLVPIRNRVMHIRPLNFDDLPNVTNFAEILLRDKSNYWQSTTETLERLKRDPSFVLGLEIPASESPETIAQNLPLPDFDETGLIGRDNLVNQLKKLCLGSFPVISIVGEGGVGKSALALKVAYELLEDGPFEAIIWVTSKTMQISANEIREIKGAISSSIGVINEISNQLGVINENDSLNEVIDYLSTFKIALFIDNLETILDENIRNFVGSLPQGSKIIITSRIGLGAYEYPIKLNGIEEKYASQLLRTLGKIRNISTLIDQDEHILRKYANRMHLSPGYIKWFVSALQTGQTPELILQNSAIFLDFCMSNVYNYLSKDAQTLTSTMQCAPGWKDIAELSHLNELEAIKIQKALQELLSTNMIVESSKSLGGVVKTTYQLSELARAYLIKKHRPDKSFQQKIQNNRNKLNALIESSLSRNNINNYNFKNIKIRTKSDHIILKILKESLDNIYSDRFDNVYEKLEEARRLAPDYFEVPRILAFYHQKTGNTPEAREFYELAITLNPGSPQLHYWFAKFLLHEEQNVEDAAKEFELANAIDPNSPEILINLARSYLFQQRFEETSKIISKLESNLDRLSDNIKKTYFDTRIQIKYRKADLYSISGDYISSIESLRLMKQEFLNLPKKLKDRHTRSKLKKTKIILQRIERGGTKNDIAFAREFSKWCDTESTFGHP